MTGEFDALELGLRQLSGVVSVGFANIQDRGGTLRVQIATSDALGVDRIAAEARALAAGHLDCPALVDVKVITSTQTDLGIEEEIRALPGVLFCEAKRDPRGEVLSIWATVADLQSEGLVRRIVQDRIGEAFAKGKLSVDVGPTVYKQGRFRLVNVSSHQSEHSTRVEVTLAVDSRTAIGAAEAPRVPGANLRSAAHAALDALTMLMEPPPNLTLVDLKTAELAGEQLVVISVAYLGPGAQRRLTAVVSLDGGFPEEAGSRAVLSAMNRTLGRELDRTVSKGHPAHHPPPRATRLKVS